VLDAKTAARCTDVKEDKNPVTSNHHICTYAIAFQAGDYAAHDAAKLPQPGRSRGNRPAGADGADRARSHGNQCYFERPDCRGVARWLHQYRAWTQSATACELNSV